MLNCLCQQERRKTNEIRSKIESYIWRFQFGDDIEKDNNTRILRMYMPCNVIFFFCILLNKSRNSAEINSVVIII